MAFSYALLWLSMESAFIPTVVSTEAKPLCSMALSKNWFNFVANKNKRSWNYSILLNFSLPWDQFTAFGYWAEFIFSCASGVAYLIVFGSMALLFVGIALHFKAFYKIYKHWFSQLGTSKENQTDTQLLVKLIKFNIGAKEWVPKYLKRTLIASFNVY